MNLMDVVMTVLMLFFLISGFVEKTQTGVDRAVARLLSWGCAKIGRSWWLLSVACGWFVAVGLDRTGMSLAATTTLMYTFWMLLCMVTSDRRL